MKNILLILTAILLVSIIACTKARQKVFHHKNWENIQGTWDMEQLLINGVDETSLIKDATWDTIYKTKCYSTYKISYKTSEQSFNRLHVLRLEKYDMGEAEVEKNNYKKIRFHLFNLNISDILSGYYLGCKHPLEFTSVLWDINTLTENQLIITATVDNVGYFVKYKKI